MQLSADDTERMIMDNMGLVYDILRKQFAQHRYDEEYIQAGRIQLWIAIKNYDEVVGKGMKAFSSYAHTSIYRAISRYHALKYRGFDKLLSMETPVTDEFTLGDLLVSDGQTDSLDSNASVNDIIARVKLHNPRAADMLQQYASGKTFDEIGTEYSITRERVRIICQKCSRYFKWGEL